MIKKTMLSSLILACASSTIYASPTTTYVGGGLGVGGYSQQSGFRGGSLNIFAGKGKLLDKEGNLYIGGEIGADFNFNPSNSNTLGLNVSVLPGLMITKSTMVYGRVGLATAYAHKDYLSFGTQLGVGIQTKVAKNWDVRTEYTSFGGGHNGNELGVGLVYKFD